MFQGHKIQVYNRSGMGSIGRGSSVEQEWHSSGSCPAGTIPIRRLPKNAIESNITMMQPFPPTSNTIVTDNSNSPRDEFAVAVGLDWPYHGASALLPSYRPAKIELRESSITCIGIAATVDTAWVMDHHPGDFPPDTTNQIVVGLMNDGAKRQRCYNLQCHGFVQTSNKIALGTSFIDGGSSISYDGVPYVSMSIHKVSGQQQWWVSVNDTVIGYFPHTLFPTFFPNSHVNQLGGIVHNSRPHGMHTDTVMGNGRTPESGGSAVVKAYLAIAANGMDKKDRPITFGATAPKCYDAAVLGQDPAVPGYNIAYGGPGGSGCDQ
ncbi:hypothetical protein EJB05_18979 [Eragrostis curvula]|uniref:Neprosin PEP catalytic domain-containing protein n=1 Tax=Eragrostis curvula TaxID=38414 RepID=A0A5J9VNG0_9POAL|nr:hypothetical protein EJB05_18979 [Eragrostis curvula]